MDSHSCAPRTHNLNAPRHDSVTAALYRAWTALSAYDAEFQVFGFTLFEQGPDLVWRPQRDFTFGGGGLPGPSEETAARRYEGW